MRPLDRSMCREMAVNRFAFLGFGALRSQISSQGLLGLLSLEGHRFLRMSSQQHQGVVAFVFSKP